MCLQRKPIEQRDDGGTGRRLLGHRCLILILELVHQRSEHLPRGAKELDLLALDEIDIAFAQFPQGANLSHGELDQEHVIGDFLDVRLGDHLSGHIFDKIDNPAPGRAALLRVPPIPKLDFAWHYLLTVLNALLPVFEYPCFLKTILDPPIPHVTKLLKEGFPSPQAPGKSPVGQPPFPERNHLLQGSLVREDHEYAAPKGLVRSRLAITAQGEEIIVRRDFFDLDFGQPLHSRHCFHGANELVYRPHRLQHHHFLGDEITCLHLQPRPPLLQRLLQPLELW